MIKKIALGVVATTLIAGQAVAADVRPARVNLKTDAQGSLPAPAKVAVRKKNKATGVETVAIPLAAVGAVGLGIAVAAGGGDGGSDD
jgi:hypothetical protein